MLLAEIHGKYVREAQSSEDYLTSTVFGHLRYVRSGAFWDTLFSLAVSLPIAGKPITLANYIKERTGKSLSAYSLERTLFWPSHPKGTPDLVLQFEAPAGLPAVIVIEAKLDAGKSGTGEEDQLARYLQILDSPSQMSVELPANAVSALVYLTVEDSRTDIAESLAVYGDDPHSSRARLYALQWQDIVAAAEQTDSSNVTEHFIVEDVSAFLKRRNLEYFAGMVPADDMPLMSEGDGELFVDEPLFADDAIPADLAEIREGWVYGD